LNKHEKKEKKTKNKTKNIMKSIIYTLAILLTLVLVSWNTQAQVIVGYSDLFTFDTRLTDVEGTVSDDDTGGTISDALVIIGQDSTYSQPNGSYSFEDVPTGNWVLYAYKDGYQEYVDTVFISGDPTQTIDISLLPTVYVVINDSLTAYANNVTEDPSNVFTLSGNVNINDILQFDGDLTIDIRPQLDLPELSGSCEIYTTDIGSHSTYNIKPGNISFEYYAEDNRLIPTELLFLVDGGFAIGGFPITIGEIIIDPECDYIEIKSIAKMPFPIDKVMEEFVKKFPGDLPLLVEEISGSLILSKTNGVEIAFDINNITVNLVAVRFENLHLYFNTNTQTFGGGYKMVIPGVEASGDGNLDSTFFNSEMNRLPVEIRDEDNQVVGNMSLYEFVENQRARGFKLVSFGAEIEFITGFINKIILSIGVKVPIGNTGLFLTEVTGGFDDLATGKWKLIANVDIAVEPEVPILGAPVKLNDFGVEIQPFSSFKGGGEFQVFEQTISEGYIEFKPPKLSLAAECKLNLIGLMKGRTKMSLNGNGISGSGKYTIKTPGKSELPWFLHWAANKRVGSAKAKLKNTKFTSKFKVGPLKLAMKLKYGKSSFPWFHLYLGKNLNKLKKVWKGEKDGKQVVTFEVPENSLQLLVVAMDTINPTLFDFSIENPSGHIFDKDNAYYYDASEAHNQTIMSILNPRPGEWDFLTGYEGQIGLDVSITNQEISMLTSQPMTRRSRSNKISLSINDFADTMNVQVYYNDNRRYFNGTMIDEFRIINNGKLEFTWHNEHLPNGEYFIYTQVDDGYNAPYLQYAPGSIWVENHDVVESPTNFTCVQGMDTLLIEWDEPVLENIMLTTVYYKNISTGRIEEETVFPIDTVVLRDLKPGQEYQLWARFIDVSGNLSEPSTIINHIFTVSDRNNPPYFTLEPDSLFFFEEGQEGQYELTANDADGDLLTFDIPDDTLGIVIDNGMVTWTPVEGDRGIYDLMVIVTDGSATDTTYQQFDVYAGEQLAVEFDFSSRILYEEDNLFIKIRNYFCPDPYQQVTLKNLRTQEETIVSTMRMDEFEYIGQFELSHINQTDLLVEDGDTIQAKYNYEDVEYLAYSYYDTLPQPSDKIAPIAINDLSIEPLQDDFIKLKWTAPGNDADTGKAYRYDIRYAYESINTEELYTLAFRIENYLYPSPAGDMDSLIINLAELEEITQHAIIYFSIKAEDETQNLSELSNSPFTQCSLNPSDVIAMIENTYYIALHWEGPLPADHITGLQYYNVFRKISEDELSLLQSGITQTEYTDNLKELPDGTYQYAVQAIYDSVSSDTVLSPSVLLERFVNVNILLSLSDSNNYQGIAFEMTGLDDIYSQHFSHNTGATGLLWLDNVFYGDYAVEASKINYNTLHDTINVSKNNYSFNLELSAINPGSIIDISKESGQFFTLYPNPNDGFFILEIMDEDQIRAIQVEIYDMMGGCIKQILLTGQRLYELDLSSKPGGIYLVRVIKGDKVGAAKVIKN